MKKTVASANRADREVSVCGDMASREPYLLFLLGIGIRFLSVDPGYLPRAQKAISTIDLVEAEEIAEDILSKARISDVTEALDVLSEQ